MKEQPIDHNDQEPEIDVCSLVRAIPRLPPDEPCFAENNDRWHESFNNEEADELFFFSDHSSHDCCSKKRVRFAQDITGKVLCTYYEAPIHDFLHNEDLWGRGLELSPRKCTKKNSSHHHMKSSNNGPIRMVPTMDNEICDRLALEHVEDRPLARRRLAMDAQQEEDFIPVTNPQKAIAYASHKDDTDSAAHDKESENDNNDDSERSESHVYYPVVASTA